MKAKKKRRSASFPPLFYQRVRKYCEAIGVSVAGWMMRVLKAELDRLKVPDEVYLEPKHEHKEGGLRVW